MPLTEAHEEYDCDHDRGLVLDLLCLLHLLRTVFHESRCPREALCLVDFSETVSVSCLAEHLRMLLGLMGLDCLCVGERDWTFVDCSSLNWTFDGVPLLFESCLVEVGLDVFRRRVRFLLEVHSAVVAACLRFCLCLLRNQDLVFVDSQNVSAVGSAICQQRSDFPTTFSIPHEDLPFLFVILQVELPRSS
jgi:hypothetical protein